LTEIFQIVLGVEMESTSELNALQTLAANILTTDSIIPFFCWLLWMQILNLQVWM
jgi:hypothetical protein